MAFVDNSDNIARIRIPRNHRSANGSVSYPQAFEPFLPGVGDAEGVAYFLYGFPSDVVAEEGVPQEVKSLLRLLDGKTGDEPCLGHLHGVFVIIPKEREKPLRRAWFFEQGWNEQNVCPTAYIRTTIKGVCACFRQSKVKLDLVEKLRQLVHMPPILKKVEILLKESELRRRISKTRHGNLKIGAMKLLTLQDKALEKRDIRAPADKFSVEPVQISRLETGTDSRGELLLKLLKNDCHGFYHC